MAVTLYDLAGSDAGRAVLAELPHRPATGEDSAAADAIVARTGPGTAREGTL